MELLLEAERALDEGRLEEALKRYEQVVGSDPRNAIAMVGLARVAIARGDDRTAAAHIDRALATDPDNAVARRHAADLAQRVGSIDPLSSVRMPPDVIPPAVNAADPNAAALRAGEEPARKDPARPGFLRRLLGRD